MLVKYKYVIGVTIFGDFKTVQISIMYYEVLFLGNLYLKILAVEINVIISYLHYADS